MSTREPVGSDASEFAELMSFAAVKPSIAPLFHDWCSPFHEWLRSLLSQYTVLWKGRIGGFDGFSGSGLPVFGSAS